MSCEFDHVLDKALVGEASATELTELQAHAAACPDCAELLAASQLIDEHIRELQNIIYRVSCLADEVAGLRHLPDTIRPMSANAAEKDEKGRMHSLDEMRTMAKHSAEEQFLTYHLKRNGGHVTALARELEMNRSYLQNLMKKHGLTAKDFKDGN